MSGAAPPFRHDRQARNRRGALSLLALWGVLLAFWLWLDAAWWVVGAVAALSLPAALDILRDRRAGLTMDCDCLTWWSGARRGDMALSRLETVWLDTRLDFSVRVTLGLRDGGRLRLPPDATPPHRAFEQALDRRNIATERRHFFFL